VALSLKTLASARDAAGRTEEALPFIEEAVAIHRETLGPDNVQTVLGVLLRARLEARTARLAEAQRDCREALALVAANKNFGSRRVANAHSSCGGALAEAGRLDEAEAHLADAVTRFRAAGVQGATLARALDAQGDVARRRGRLAQAALSGREAAAIQVRVSGEENPRLALYRAHTGAALCAAGQREEGERLLRDAVAALQRAFPDGHFDLATGLFLLGEALMNSGRAAEARPLLQRALEWRQAHLGPGDPRTVIVRTVLGKAAS
jgi:tetratricopeptide (TPR) repeat protein